MGQSFSMDAGLQDDIDLKQTALSAAAGGLFTGLGELGGAALRGRKGKVSVPADDIPHDAPLDAHFKAELDAADIISKPALTTHELPDLRAANDNAHARPVEPGSQLEPAAKPTNDHADAAPDGEGKPGDGPASDRDPLGCCRLGNQWLWLSQACRCCSSRNPPPDH